MRPKTILLFFLISVISSTGIAQDLTTKELDSIGIAYFYQAFEPTKPLSDKEKIKIYLQADSLFRITENWEFSIVSILGACKALQIERSYEELNQLSKEALQIAQSQLDEYNYYLGLALNLRAGILYETIRDHKNAIPLYKKTLEINRKNNIPADNIAHTYFNIGTSYQEIGDYDLSIEQSQKALGIQLDSVNADIYLTPNVYNQLGYCYRKKGQFELAEQYYLSGLQAAKKIQPNTRDVDQIILYLYQNLVDLYLEFKQLKTAQKYVQLALNFQKGQSFIKDHYTHQLQAAIYLEEKKYGQAFQAFRNSTDAALQEYQELKIHPAIGLTYLQRAEALLAQEKIAEALQYFQLALVHHATDFEAADVLENPSETQLINPLNTIDIFKGKAQAFFKKYQKNNTQEDLNYAFEHYSLAIQTITKTRQSFDAEGSKHTLAAKVIPVYEGAINTVFELYQTSKDTKWLEKGLQFSEGDKSAALLEAMQNNDAMNSTGISDSLLQQEQSLQVDIAFYEKLIHNEKQKKENPNQAKIGSLQQSLFNLKENYQQLIDYFEITYPQYFTLKFKSQQFNLQKIQQQLGTNAMIEFFVGAKYIFVFTITKATISCERILKSKDFENNINQLRRLISTAPTSKTIVASFDNFKSTAHLVYQNLLQASIQKLGGSTDQLIIIPDDLLAYIPFSVLLENQEEAAYKDLPYLFKKFGLSYNYSAALWLRQLSKQGQAAMKKFLGFAPEFSQVPGANQLGALSCNLQEVQQIGAAFSPESLRLEGAASLTHFQQHAKNYQIIHLATHATLDQEDSKFNRIYFADDYLNQTDLYQLELNADLVVLSACNTGTGVLKKGEGVMSLSRGFVYSGCPSLLMSLWSVDDCTTADIMLNYYQALDQGWTKDLALKQAKEKHLSQTDNILQMHPYYWAAFVQHGNTYALSVYPSKWKIYALAGFLLVALIGVFMWWKK